MNENIEAINALLRQTVPSVKFEHIGDSVTGRIVDMQLVDQTDFLTREPVVDRNGEVKRQLVIGLIVAERLGPGDDGARKLFAKNSMLNTIATVARPSGGLDIGGVLSVSYVGDGVARGGFGAPKLYRASYTAPTERPSWAPENFRKPEPAPEELAANAAAFSEIDKLDPNSDEYFAAIREPQSTLELTPELRTAARVMGAVREEREPAKPRRARSTPSK